MVSPDVQINSLLRERHFFLTTPKWVLLPSHIANFEDRKREPMEKDGDQNGAFKYG